MEGRPDAGARHPEAARASGADGKGGEVGADLRQLDREREVGRGAVELAGRDDVARTLEVAEDRGRRSSQVDRGRHRARARVVVLVREPLGVPDHDHGGRRERSRRVGYELWPAGIVLAEDPRAGSGERAHLAALDLRAEYVCGEERARALGVAYRQRGRRLVGGTGRGLVCHGDPRHRQEGHEHGSQDVQVSASHVPTLSRIGFYAPGSSGPSPRTSCPGALRCRTSRTRSAPRRDQADPPSP